MLLVWLVVPVEAAGAARAAGGMAATLAAAAGASTVLGYWAGVEANTAGGLGVLSKGGGVARIMSTNLRRVKRDGIGQDMPKVA